MCLSKLIPKILRAKRVSDKSIKTGLKGISIIKEWEELRLEAYFCPVGILTIGWGHTGPDVKEDQRITKERAEELLREDVGVAERAILKYVEVEINQNQFDALASFIFNVGASAFAGSTLLRKLNVGDFEGASMQFRRWNKGKVNGVYVVLNGLTKRRLVEYNLFISKE